MKLLYFAWLRTRIGIGQEDVALPAEVATVAQLLDWLKRRGPAYADALSNLALVRVSVNQHYAGADRALHADDEVALFPPVTGG